MTLSITEKWLVQLLTTAPNFTLPAADIIAAAASADVGSPATIQRAGTTVAIKARRGGISHWKLRGAHHPASETPPARPEVSAGPRDGWSITAFRDEAARRGLDSTAETTEAELELALYIDDHGGHDPQPSNPKHVRNRVPFGW